jgi:hypothetical protein
MLKHSTARLVLAVALTIPATATAQEPAFPWKSLDPPPAVAGLRLGDSRARLDSVMGEPESVQDLGSGLYFFGYRGGSVIVGYAELDGIAIIHLRTREAGEIGGVRVGDSLGSVRERWGAPQTEDHLVSLYIVDWWVVAVYADQSGERVAMLTLGITAESGGITPDSNPSVFRPERPRPFPWNSGDPPPAVAGLRLGDSRARLNSVMGEPESVQNLGAVDIFRYRGGSIRISCAELGGVAAIDLKTREAGEIGGVRVGDSLSSVFERWGAPNGGGGRVSLYIVDWWVVAVYSDRSAERVTMLGLGTAAESLQITPEPPTRVTGPERPWPFPFTRAQNADGAKFVWFAYKVGGFTYDYVPAALLPDHPRFRAITDPRAGDVAWWPEYVALVADSNSVLTAEGPVPLQELTERFGTPTYFRHQVPRDEEGAGPAVKPFRLVAERVEFNAPAGWRVIDRVHQDTLGMVLFHVPNSWTDSLSAYDRTNVLVAARQRSDDQSLQVFSDSLFAAMHGDVEPDIVLDHSDGATTRTIEWRGDFDGTPYLITDHFAVVDGVYVNLRVGRPKLDVIPESWVTSFVEEMEGLLAGLTVDGNPIFAGAGEKP